MRKRDPLSSLLRAACAFLLLGRGAAHASTTVTLEELLAAMAPSRGYNILATTNAARFDAEVLLRLARAARAREPQGGPLLIRQEEWFPAFLKTAGIEAEAAPEFARLAHEHGQDFMVEYRESRVVAQVLKGPAPAMAAHITFSWAGRPDPAPEYSYEDALSTPKLHATNKRVITYDLLDYGDEIVFDRVDGFYGRPTSGLLGLLFRVIGDGRLVEYRMAVAPDGTVVARGRSRKGFVEVGATLTIRPDGTSEKGVPADPALRALEERLKRPFALLYQPAS